MRKLSFFAILGICILFFNQSAAAQTAAPTIRLQPFLSGLSAPVLATHARDGSRRLFVVQQGGIIKVVQPGTNTATDFMNITTKVLSGGERGLLGLAFHPEFATNGYFFVNYTRQTDGATVIARYKTTSAANTLGDPNSERILLTIAQPFSNHNGGMIEFRTDNGVHNLYIGMGDGGSANDPGNRAQNINELLGKFLRITPDVSGSPTAPAYTVPTDNPYAGATPGADEIYAIGLRNPWRWSFDRGGTRQLWAGDVGQGAREEISIITLGGNFGWRIMEGAICTPGVNPNCTPPVGHIPPVFDYPRTSPRCSITGGYVYRGAQNALPNGSYVYGDYCSGEILLWHNNQQLLLLDTSRSITSFGEDEDGELYVVGQGGTVEKIARVAKANADFDNDGKTDLSIFRPSTGVWYILNSSNNSVRGLQFGTNGDIPASGDYDGDGFTDVGVFRPSNGVWYWLNSGNNTVNGVQFGANGDVPLQGDYDGDAKTDLVVYRPSNNTWYRLNSSNSAISGIQFGAPGDNVAPADYDGDGRMDIGVFRRDNGNWYRINSSTNTVSGLQFGGGLGVADYPIPADYDGDGKADVAVVRSFSVNYWYILRSSDNTAQTVQFSGVNDQPAVGDYNGDGRDDIAVFRGINGTWYTSTDPAINFGARQFGQLNDLSVPSYERP